MKAPRPSMQEQSNRRRAAGIAEPLRLIGSRHRVPAVERLRHNVADGALQADRRGHQRRRARRDPRAQAARDARNGGRIRRVHQRRLAKGDNGLDVHSSTEFEDKMYPWFEPSTAPLSTEDLHLLDKPGVAGTRARYRRPLRGMARRLDGSCRERRRHHVRGRRRRRRVHGPRLVGRRLPLRCTVWDIKESIRQARSTPT